MASYPGNIPNPKRNSLVGRAFHTFTETEHNKHRLQYQGQITDQLPDGYYVVEFFDWLTGYPTWSGIVHISDMADTRKWHIYDDIEHMATAYKIHHRNWERDEPVSE